MAALGWHCSELIMNLHLRYQHYDIVTGSGRRPRGNVKRSVDYLVCFVTSSVDLSKSHDIEIVRATSDG